LEDLCRDKSFAELTEYSHGLAWSNTKRDREMSVKDILREAGEDEAYVEYLLTSNGCKKHFYNGFTCSAASARHKPGNNTLV